MSKKLAKLFNKPAQAAKAITKHQKSEKRWLKFRSFQIVSMVLIFITAVILQQVIPQENHAKAADLGIHNIKHVVVIMQENRSFDSYFGTYPGVDGIPMSNGVPTVCNPDPTNNTCVKPYNDHNDVTQGGPHTSASTVSDINNGQMDGFVSSAHNSQTSCFYAAPNCQDGPYNTTDVMGYKVRSDIPNYWKYADNFVLQDHMYEPNSSWSLPEHLFQVSGWSASCTTHNDPSSCTNSLDQKFGGNANPIHAWTDMTYLLHKYAVSWGYYVTNGTEPDCENNQNLSCEPVPQTPTTPGIWNPLPLFDTVKNDNQLGNIKSVSNFYSEAQAGTLPAVSWVVPSGDNSEHPPSQTSSGQSYVTSLVNAVMRSPDWNSTAIFVSWDDWGGFYDHVNPPVVDENGYGLRVPGLVISPFAKHGYIDSQTLSFDAFNKFIEDDFLNGQRLDPLTDGRPDPRPTVRENVSILGDLSADFDFTQTPRPALLLPVHPTTTLTLRTPYQPVNVSSTPGNGQATLKWKTPFTNGGYPITSYRVIPYLNGVAQPTRIYTTFNPSNIIETVTGLTNAKSYTFRAAAVNQLGVGIWSLPTPAITIGTPLAPTGISATAGTGYAKVSFLAPSSNNGSAITSYIITPYIGWFAQKSSTFGPTAITRTIYGLTAGTTYTFRVTATNANGTGVSSVNSNAVTPN